MFSYFNDKELILGTAMWGWSVDRATAFSLLDKFYESGYRWLDTATNYPINKKADDFRRAEEWLEEWCKINKIVDMRILVKVGSLANDGSSDINLAPSFLLMSSDFYHQKFSENLACLSVHWDNSDDFLKVQNTVSAFKKFSEYGLEIGLSGVKNPHLYAEAAPELLEHWLIQTQENLFTNKARLHYQQFFPDARYLAYGINSGGLSFNNSYKPNSSLILRNKNDITNLGRYEEFLIKISELNGSPRTFNELALLAIYHNSAISGVVIGPSKMEQLIETIDYWEILQKGVDLEIIKSFVGNVLENA